VPGDDSITGRKQIGRTKWIEPAAVIYSILAKGAKRRGEMGGALCSSWAADDTSEEPAENL